MNREKLRREIKEIIPETSSKGFMAVEEEGMISSTIITVEALIGIEEVVLMYIENKGFPIDNDLR